MVLKNECKRDLQKIIRDAYMRWLEAYRIQVQMRGEVIMNVEEIFSVLAKAVAGAGYVKGMYWTSVDKKLPDEDGIYIVCTKRGKVYQARYYIGRDQFGGKWGQKDRGKNITHWMAMPEAPVEVREYDDIK